MFDNMDLITTDDTNPLTDYINNTKHMIPVILSANDKEKWLDPKLGKSDFERLLRTFSAERKDAYVINNDFLNKRLMIPRY